MGVIVTDLEISDWFRQLENQIDLWITDPPYPFNSQNGTGRFRNMYTRFTWDHLGEVYRRMYEYAPDGGRLYTFCNRDGKELTKELLVRAGWILRNDLVWNKLHFAGGYHWRNQIEYVVYASKNKPAVYVKGVGNIFEYKRPSKNSGIPAIGYDPTSCSSPKPWEIWRDIIEQGGKEGDVCADPFAGSNPMKAALDLHPHLMNKIKVAYTNIYNT